MAETPEEGVDKAGELADAEDDGAALRMSGCDDEAHRLSPIVDGNFGLPVEPPIAVNVDSADAHDHRLPSPVSSQTLGVRSQGLRAAMVGTFRARELQKALSFAGNQEDAAADPLPVTAGSHENADSFWNVEHPETVTRVTGVHGHASGGDRTSAPSRSSQDAMTYSRRFAHRLADMAEHAQVCDDLLRALTCRDAGSAGPADHSPCKQIDDVHSIRQLGNEADHANSSRRRFWAMQVAQAVALVFAAAPKNDTITPACVVCCYFRGFISWYNKGNHAVVSYCCSVLSICAIITATAQHLSDPRPEQLQGVCGLPQRWFGLDWFDACKTMYHCRIPTILFIAISSYIVYLGHYEYVTTLAEHVKKHGSRPELSMQRKTISQVMAREEAEGTEHPWELRRRANRRKCENLSIEVMMEELIHTFDSKEEDDDGQGFLESKKILPMCSSVPLSSWTSQSTPLLDRSAKPDFPAVFGRRLSHSAAKLVQQQFHFDGKPEEVRETILNGLKHRVSMHILHMMRSEECAVGLLAEAQDKTAMVHAVEKARCLFQSPKPMGRPLHPFRAWLHPLGKYGVLQPLVFAVVTPVPVFVVILFLYLVSSPSARLSDVQPFVGYLLLAWFIASAGCFISFYAYRRHIIQMSIQWEDTFYTYIRIKYTYCHVFVLMMMAAVFSGVIIEIFCSTFISTFKTQQGLELVPLTLFFLLPFMVVAMALFGDASVELALDAAKDPPLSNFMAAALSFAMFVQDFLGTGEDCDRCRELPLARASCDATVGTPHMDVGERKAVEGRVTRQFSSIPCPFSCTLVDTMFLLMEIIPIASAVGGYLAHGASADRTPLGAICRSYMWGAFFVAGTGAFFYGFISRPIIGWNPFVFRAFHQSMEFLPMQVSGRMGLFKKLGLAIRNRHILPGTLAITAEHAFLNSNVLDDVFDQEDDLVLQCVKDNPSQRLWKLFLTCMGRCRQAQELAHDQPRPSQMQGGTLFKNNETAGQGESQGSTKAVFHVKVAIVVIGTWLIAGCLMIKCRGQNDVQWHDVFGHAHEVPKGYLAFAVSVALVLVVLWCSWLLSSLFPRSLGRPFLAILAFFYLVANVLVIGPVMQNNAQINAGTIVEPGRARRSHLEAWNQAQYGVCMQFFGDRSAALSALDLSQLAGVVYDSSCDVIREQTEYLFGNRTVHMYHCSDYDMSSEFLPRSVVFDFPSATNNNTGTRVIAYKGTSTLADIYVDATLWSMVKVLQFSEFVLPILKVIPIDQIQWMVDKFHIPYQRPREEFFWKKALDNATRFIDGDPSVDNRTYETVLTGHSLGGGIAQVLGARLGLSTVVFSPPGVGYSAVRFGLHKPLQFAAAPNFNSAPTEIGVEVAKKKVHVFIPAGDVVPRVDLQIGVVTNIECRNADGTAARSVQCHSIQRTSCEIYRSCGDFLWPMGYPAPVAGRRNINCTEFFEDSALGKWAEPDDVI